MFDRLVPESGSPFNYVAAPQPNTRAHLVDQSYKALQQLVNKDHILHLQVGIAKPQPILLKSNAIDAGTNQAHVEVPFEVIERDEISRSYISTPDTSYPILEQDVDGPAAAMKFVEIKSDTNVGMPVILQRFEKDPALVYGEHSDYKLLDGEQLAAAPEVNHLGQVWTLASSHVVQGSDGGSTIDAFLRKASVVDIEAHLDLQVFKETHGCEEDKRVVDDKGYSGQGFAGIGALFDGCTKLYVEALSFELEEL